MNSNLLLLVKNFIALFPFEIFGIPQRSNMDPILTPFCIYSIVYVFGYDESESDFHFVTEYHAF